MSNLIQNNDLDQIRAYYLNKGELTEKQHEKAARYELIFSLYSENRSKTATVNAYMAICEKSDKYKSIGQAQAYRDLNIAEKLFTPLRQYEKGFLRISIIESALEEIKMLRSLIKPDNKLKDTLDIIDRINNAEKRLIDASGVKLNDPDLPDFAKIIPHSYTIKLPDHIADLLKDRFSNKGSIDVSEIFNFSDAEYVDLNEDNE